MIRTKHLRVLGTAFLASLLPLHLSCAGSGQAPAGGPCTYVRFSGKATVTELRAADGAYWMVFDATFEGAQPDPSLVTVQRELVGYWRFEEGLGTSAADTSGAGNNGTLVNAPVWVEGKTGKGLRFGLSANTNVELPSLPALNGPFTFATWVKFDVVNKNGNNTILSAGTASNNQGLMIHEGGGKPFMGFYGNDLEGKTQLQAGVWTHLVFMYDGSQKKIYVNGVLDATQACARYQGSVTNVRLGQKRFQNLDILQGTLDEVKVYSRALTDAEVAAQFNGTVNVIVSPRAVSLFPGATQAFGASVTGTSQMAVTWELPDADSGSITQEGVYTPPSTVIGGSRTIRVMARSVADPTQTNAAMVTLNPLYLAQWSFEEGSGTTAEDVSGQGHKGTLTDAPGWVDGKFGKALDFGTANARLLIGTPVTIGAEWTISAWFKYPLPLTGTWHTLTRGSSIDHQIIIGQDQVSLGCYDNNAGTFRDSGFRMNTLGKGWHHLAAVGSGGTTRFYVDGQPVGNVIPWQSRSNICAVGNYQNGTQAFGTLDEVIVYNRALTGAELAAKFNAVVNVVVAPRAATLTPGMTQAFSASVTGTPDTAVTWELPDADSGTITAEGLYTAPATASGAGRTIRVVARSVADPTQTCIVMVVLNPLHLAYWPFDEGAGTTAADASGQGHTGTLTDGPLWMDGRLGKALDFAASNARTLVSPVVSLGQDWSISAWFRYPLPQTGTCHTLVRGSSKDHQIFVNQDEVSLGCWDNTANCFRDSGFRMNTLSTGWHHLVAVGTDETTRFYVDGQPVGTVIPWQSHSDICAVGNYQGGTQVFGALDDVKVIGRALAPADVANLVNIGPTVTLSPGSASLLQGQSQVFTATVVGTANKAVTWELPDPDSGSITADGRYTAPATVSGSSQVFRVVARSVEDPSQSCVATVRVRRELMGWYGFEEGQGTRVADLSGTGNDGTLVNESLWVDGKSGKALRMKGNNASVDVPGLNPFNGPFTVLAWVKFNSLSNGIINAILGHGELSTGKALHLGEYEGTLYFGFCGDDLKGSRALKTGVWTHVAFVFDGTQKRIYVDGILDSSAASGAYRSTLNNAQIGRFPWQYSWPGGRTSVLDGSIDEVKVYSRALSAQEILASYGPLTVTPRRPVLLPGATQQFQASAPGTGGATVQWTASAGTITAQGLYTAPAQSGLYTITATRSDDPGHPEKVMVDVVDASAALGFSLTSNPNGAWSYGWVPRLGGTFTALAGSRTESNGLQVWNPSGYPRISINPTDNPIVVTASPQVAIQPRQLNLHPGPSGENAVARWTVPADGTYTVSAQFWGGDAYPTTTDVHVQVNGFSVFDGMVNRYLVGPSYDGTLVLKAGDRLDLLVGYGSNGTYNYDTTGVECRIRRFKGNVTLLPAKTTLAPGATLQFTATLPELSDNRVQWSVEDSPAGGTISSDGLYTAPTASGIYRVKVCSVMDASLSADAVVIVNGGDLYSGCYAFEEGAGATTADASGRGITGLLRGNAQWTADGRAGKGLAFDGVDSYVDIPGVNPFRGPFTIAAWVKFDALKKGTDNAILGHGCAAANEGLNCGEWNGKPYFVFYGNELAGNTELQTGTWTHLVFVYNGMQRKIYVNGALDAAKDSAAYAGTLDNARIGQYPWNYAWPKGTVSTFWGHIDEVQVYGRALSNADVANLYRPFAAMAVRPNTASLSPGQSLAFRALVAGSPSSAVTWELPDADSGSVTADGVFTAPAILSESRAVRVQARQTGGTNQTAAATVTVQRADRINAAGVLEVSGVYDTNHGVLNLFQAAGTVSGTSTDGSGSTLQGSVGGLVLSGTMSGNYAGNFSLTFSANASTFTGTLPNGSSWTGTRRLDTLVMEITNKPVAMQVGSRLAMNLRMGGTMDRRVLWSCTAGSIDQQGVYTAPATPGMVTVRAVSQAYPGQYVAITFPVTLDGRYDYSGTWTTYTGSGSMDMVLFQRGGMLTGFWYASTSGWGKTYKVSGSLNGANAHLTFYVGDPNAADPGIACTADVVFSADGQSYTGKHSYYGNGWNGSRKAGVTVMVDPGTLELEPGGTGLLKVLVAGCLDKTVVWNVPSGQMMPVDPWTFEFRAPQSEGNVALTAVSVVDTTRTATATVHVGGQGDASLTISPGSVKLGKGGTAAFSVAVTGLEDTRVTWFCSGGTIDANGNYVAPAAFGTYTVTVHSVADPEVVDSATVVVSSSVAGERGFTYDLNGNLTSDGEKTYEWDAENRLVAVTINATGHRSEFGYDGLGRRVQIRELGPDATQTLQVTSAKKCLWDGVEITEERSADGGTVTKRFYKQGFMDSDGTVLFYTRDHLGSIRELTDNTQAVRARYDYDPYGRQTKISGDKESVQGYTGHFWHAQSGLNLTLFRAYDPNLGRWVSRDPLGEASVINIYAYVDGDVIGSLDPNGLEKLTPSEINCIGYALGVGCALDPGDSSLLEMTRKRGFSCHQVAAAKECKCDKCDEKVVIFIEWRSGGPTHPWRDKWPKGTAGGINDVHAIHQDDDGSWSHVPGRFPIGTPPSTGFPDPDKLRPDDYSLTYCCCKSKK